MKVNVKIAQTAGFCFGVRRAINLAERIAQDKKMIYTFGPIIHNPQEIKRLEQKGIKPVNELKGIKNITLIIRTHGIPRVLRKKMEQRKIKLVDATCPFVKRAQDIVKKLSEKEYQIIIIGDKTHPEVAALVSYAKDGCSVIKIGKELDKIKLLDKIGVVSQTTQSPETFNEIVNYLIKLRPKAKIYNTICKATVARQDEAMKIAKSVDLMIIVGGKNSGNTKRLFEICKKYTTSFHIETDKEIKPNWFKSIKSLGLTAGASTPDWIIKKVENKINQILNK